MNASSRPTTNRMWYLRHLPHIGVVTCLMALLIALFSVANANVDDNQAENANSSAKTAPGFPAAFENLVAGAILPPAPVTVKGTSNAEIVNNHSISPNALAFDNLFGDTSNSAILKNPVSGAILPSAPVTVKGASNSEIASNPPLGPGALAETTLPGGTRLAVTIENPADGATRPPGPVTVMGTAHIGPAMTANIALVYVIDLSGSVNYPGYEGCGGDQNNDGSSNRVLDCEILTYITLNEMAVESGIVREAGVAVFGEMGATADVGPESGEKLLTGPATDVDSYKGSDLEQVAHSAWVDVTKCIDDPESKDPLCIHIFNSGIRLFLDKKVGRDSTNYAAGISAALTVANASTAPIKIVVFLSDGGNNDGAHVNTVLPAGDVIFHTFAIGELGYCQNLEQPNLLGDLQTIAGLTGGECTRVENTSDLPGAVLGVINLKAQLVSLEMSVDGGAPVAITNAEITPDLPLSSNEGGVTFETQTGSLGAGSHTICVTANGEDLGGSGSATDCHTIMINTPPTVDAGADVKGDEGAAIALDGTVADPDSSPTINWGYVAGDSVDAGATCTFANGSPVDTTISCTDDGSYIVTLTANDGINPAVSDTAKVTVFNVPPRVQISAPVDDAVVQIGETLNLAAEFSDPGIIDTHSCTIDWGDGTPATVGEVAETDGGGSCPGAHSYTSGGSFTIRVTIADDDGASGEDTVTVKTNNPPNCSVAKPNIDFLWPPDHQFVPIVVMDVTDPDGDNVSILITSIFQDEPVDTYGDGNFTPDGMGVGTSTIQLRAERSGTKKVPGDGRFYHITFDATDGLGGFCSGALQIVVPHDQAKPAIDGGSIYDSTAVSP